MFTRERGETFRCPTPAAGSGRRRRRGLPRRRPAAPAAAQVFAEEGGAAAAGRTLPDPGACLQPQLCSPQLGLPAAGLLRRLKVLLSTPARLHPSRPRKPAHGASGQPGTRTTGAGAQPEASVRF